MDTNIEREGGDRDRGRFTVIPWVLGRCFHLLPSAVEALHCMLVRYVVFAISLAWLGQFSPNYVSASS